MLKEEKEGADRGEDASLHCRGNNQIVILAWNQPDEKHNAKSSGEVSIVSIGEAQDIIWILVGAGCPCEAVVDVVLGNSQ